MPKWHIWRWNVVNNPHKVNQQKLEKREKRRGISNALFLLNFQSSSWMTEPIVLSIAVLCRRLIKFITLNLRWKTITKTVQVEHYWQRCYVTMHANTILREMISSISQNEPRVGVLSANLATLLCNHASYRNLTRFNLCNLGARQVKKGLWRGCK